MKVRGAPAVWFHPFTRDIGVRCRFIIRTHRRATAKEFRKSQLLLPTLTQPGAIGGQMSAPQLKVMLKEEHGGKMDEGRISTNGCPRPTRERQLPVEAGDGERYLRISCGASTQVCAPGILALEKIKRLLLPKSW